MGRSDRELENKEARVTKGSNNLKRKLKNREASAWDWGDNLQSGKAMDNLAGWMTTKGSLKPTVEEEIRRLKEEAMALMDAAGEASKKRRKVAEAAQPVGPLKKKKKVIKQRLPQAAIEYLMARRFRPVHLIPPESLVNRSQRFLESYATKKAIADKILEYEQALINMYLAKGYAENEIEVTDDEEEN